jgi:PAS domain S-box-containing protein
MRLARDISFTRKLTLIIMLTSVVALLLACGAFVAYEWVTFRRTMVNDHAMLAKIVGANCAAAVIFDDAKSAERTLASLQAEPHLMAACIFTTDYRVFASYVRSDLKGWIPPKPVPSGESFADDHLALYRPIIHNGEQIGTVYLQEDLLEMHERLTRYAGIGLVVLLVSLCAALLLSGRLQRLVSEPILHLAQTAKEVSVGKDYEVRAPKSSGASREVDTLIDAFNEMLAQIQSRDKALQESEQHFRSLIENASDIITIIDQDSWIRYISPSAKRLLGFAPEELVGKLALDYIHPDDVKTVSAHLTQVVEVPEVIVSVEFRFHRKDGSWIYLESKARNLLSDPGLAGIIVNSRDITERKGAQTEMENMHRQLLDASRYAGMAEVATNVLHNVGNVLNSVNVSAALVSEKVQKSKVPNLARAAALMREHENDLAVFLTQDPKGTQLVSYFGTLAQHLGCEQAEILKEIESLNNNIDHIKEIVTMQQSYASASGIVDTLPIVDLVEDALRMNVGALARHEVQVVREYIATPSVPVDKHKVLQILVNLVRNAKYALDDGGRNDKRLTVRVATDGDGSVKISVIDNGVGIPPEHLTRIFAHGFTTRKNGHGFGLHSGALAAKEMGGSLSVHSDGPGQGAMFVLSLPSHREQNNS